MCRSRLGSCPATVNSTTGLHVDAGRRSKTFHREHVLRILAVLSQCEYMSRLFFSYKAQLDKAVRISRSL